MVKLFAITNDKRNLHTLLILDDGALSLVDGIRASESPRELMMDIRSYSDDEKIIPRIKYRGYVDLFHYNLKRVFSRAVTTTQIKELGDLITDSNGDSLMDYYEIVDSLESKNAVYYKGGSLFKDDLIKEGATINPSDEYYVISRNQDFIKLRDGKIVLVVDEYSATHFRRESEANRYRLALKGKDKDKVIYLTIKRPYKTLTAELLKKL